MLRDFRQHDHGYLGLSQQPLEDEADGVRYLEVLLSKVLQFLLL